MENKACVVSHPHRITKIWGVHGKNPPQTKKTGFDPLTNPKIHVLPMGLTQNQTGDLKQGVGLFPAPPGRETREMDVEDVGKQPSPVPARPARFSATPLGSYTDPCRNPAPPPGSPQARLLH